MSDTIKAIGAQYGPEGEMLAEAAIYGLTVEERARAAAALGALIQPPPPVVDFDAIDQAHEPMRRLGRAVAITAAVGEMRCWAKELGDPVLSHTLARAHGECIRVMVAAKLAVD